MSSRGGTLLASAATQSLDAGGDENRQGENRYRETAVDLQRRAGDGWAGDCRTKGMLGFGYERAYTMGVISRPVSSQQKWRIRLTIPRGGPIRSSRQQMPLLAVRRFDGLVRWLLALRFLQYSMTLAQTTLENRPVTNGYWRLFRVRRESDFRIVAP